MRRCAALALALLATAGPAAAEPLRLRGDALATLASPTGLVTLTADDEIADDVRAEAVLWIADTADALVATVEATRAHGRIHARLGRFVAVTGALRPTHVDGGSARVRLPYRMTAEAFGGVPVAPRLGQSAWDWVAGARVSRLVGDWGAVGAGYLQRRSAGRLDAEELGLDGGGALGRRADLGARAAFDLIHGGLADAQVTAGWRRRAGRVEVFAGERTASRLLPATSVFSVLGDTASRRAGVTGRWRAAPRLDLSGRAGVRDAGADAGADLLLRADLRLDDRGDGALGAELRRDLGWTGVRGTARLPRGPVTFSAEVELAFPDDADQAVWPWALAAASWRRGAWETAAAVEASASPTERYRLDLLARVGRTWELPR